MSNNNIIKNRSEILFIYDVTNANPNGDPVDENKPRIDEETGRNIVTDVRLKRTVRDYLKDFKGKEIFVREISDDEGNIQDAKQRAEDFLKDSSGKQIEKSKIKLGEMKRLIDDNILRNCIDVRLFGVTLPIEKSAKEKSSVTHTGAVQFKMGTSLHRVNLQYIKGTGAFASGKGMEQKTFREEYFLSYSLIAFWGVANENAAKETKLTEDDMTLLMDGIWNGTKNLISRSKAGQMPRLLLRVVYREGNFHIGDLDKMVKLVMKEEKEDEALRDIREISLGLTELGNALMKHRDRIERVEYKVDERVSITSQKTETTLPNLLGGLTLQEISV
ncbi:MAG: type I-B CRISPR-associated protein Cas7/Csh2 [Thermodesulfobacteriota bacterium]